MEALPASGPFVCVQRGAGHGDCVEAGRHGGDDGLPHASRRLPVPPQTAGSRPALTLLRMTKRSAMLMLVLMLNRVEPG